MEANRIIEGDCIAGMKTLPDGCVHCCVTSPPYYALRDYGVNGQIGLEETPEAYVAKMVEVFREVKRVLRDDGTLWLNIGDSYCNTDKWGGGGANTGKQTVAAGGEVPSWAVRRKKQPIEGVKPKDLMGIPWRVAFALQADGWYLRADIIWHKPAPMPESVTDRPTKAHEYLFLLTKSKEYFYDAESIKEPVTEAAKQRQQYGRKNQWGHILDANKHSDGRKFDQAKSYEAASFDGAGRNKRTVWTVATQAYEGAHFATYPPKLIEPCILAGTSERGCCSACGAPWERITERKQLKRERPNDYTKRTGEDGTGNSCANSVAGVSVVTTGWQPTCECDAELKPCIVLDPFGGSGTTAQVARSLGRDWLLCELNPDYIALAEKRIRTPLYKDDVPKQIDSMPGQKELFA